MLACNASNNVFLYFLNCEQAFFCIAYSALSYLWHQTLTHKHTFMTERYSLFHLLHKNMIVVRFHVLQLSVHQSFVNWTHIICWSLQTWYYVYKLLSFNDIQSVQSLWHVIVNVHMIRILVEEIFLLGYPNSLHLIDFLDCLSLTSSSLQYFHRDSVHKASRLLQPSPLNVICNTWAPHLVSFFGLQFHFTFLWFLLWFMSSIFFEFLPLSSRF